ncbi:hypothetical protein L7F22_067325 [Adiantum nelumboides]|nr:hypothetical protein [Adiantum nelumboides]
MKKNKVASLSLVVAMVVVLSADAIGDDYGDPDVPKGTAWCVANPAATVKGSVLVRMQLNAAPVQGADSGAALLHALHLGVACLFRLQQPVVVPLQKRN